VELLKRLVCKIVHWKGNHLGNVLAVATDKRKYFKDTVVGTDTIIIWNAYLSTANDYYPFGMLIPSRIYADTALSRQAVHAVLEYEKTAVEQEFSNATHGYTTANGATTTTGAQRLQVTAPSINAAVYYDFSTQIGSEYKFYVQVDPSTCDSVLIKVQQTSPIGPHTEAYAAPGINEFSFTASSALTRLRILRKDAPGQGSMDYFIDHVRLTRTRDTFYTDTITLATGEGYKYGFNGMEQENDWNGLGNSYDFGARVLDVRLGRWLSRDGHEQYYSNKSSYQFVSNSPILMTDYNGLDNIIYIYVGEYYMKDGKKVILTAAQQQEIFDKTVQVFEMIHNKVNGGLGVDIEFVKTSSPYNSSTLDKSDVLAMAADLDFAEGVYGTLLSISDRDDPGISKGNYLAQPAFVNIRSSMFSHTSPNYTDQIAYALAHEIIHRVTQQSGDLITDHDDDNNLPFNIMERGARLFPLPEVPLNEWDNTLPNKDASYFKLMPSRVSDFRKVFGERSPVDNATQRNNKGSRTDGKTGIVPRKIRKDFRKWERKQ
jgi:RHS repeat-associated protein